ncbi:MAG TPA: diguanylate cyclase [Dongiaceae bacterium]|nr:diguanylate cyclase [Dongiaceae bacterium]
MKKFEQLQRMNILLVEDDEHDRAAFHRAFREVEYDCTITDCVRAPEAVAMIEPDPSAFDVVVVDHHLPCQYGLDLCKELLAAAVPLPLVILTGSGSEQVAVAALKAGVDDYIIKDPDSAYLQMLPMVLKEVAATFRGRIAHMVAEKSLRESRERLSIIIEGLTVPTFVIDADHITTHWNLACEKITGIPACEVIGTRHQWRAFYSLERPVMADLIVDRVIEEEVANYYAGKYRRSELLEDSFEAEDFFSHFGEGGKWLFFTAAPLKGANGEVIGAIETLQDVTERRMAEIALKESEFRHRELSVTDGLTGLYNSRHFYTRAHEEIERCNRYGSELSLILLDVDNFKRYNDTYGHLEGDHVLAGLAEVIRREIRGSDSAYRYGGEEFIVMFPETEPAEARIVAERLRHSFEDTVFSPLPGEEARTSISIGGGSYRPEEGLRAFVKRVDEAMYRAKECGRNRVVFE